MLKNFGTIAKCALARWSPEKYTGNARALGCVIRGWYSSGSPSREQMEYDVCIVGAGPAGLTAAIKLKQLCQQNNKDLSVCVIEKGSEVGAHILSGNVFEPRALDDLLPDWRSMEDCPVKTSVVKDYFYFLTEKRKWRLPTPPQMHNKGNYIISLSEFSRWLAQQAETLGVDIYPGFAGKEVLYDWDGAVVGVGTNDFGVAGDGTHKSNYSPGVDLLAQMTLLAEGCRGSLSKEVIRRYDLIQKGGGSPQTYALGIKEVWEVPEAQHRPGLVYHTIGYPLDSSTYGGGFLYHMSDRRVALGLVVGLDYRNPYLSPYQEFQRWKSHPLIKGAIEGGTCLQYGARTLNEGGVQAIPQLSFPGGALIGCSAGFLNVPKIKGTHTAMYSGMLAAFGAFESLTDGKVKGPITLSSYDTAIRNSWVYDELNKVRNIRPGFQYGLLAGLINAGLETYLLRGHAPWTLKYRRPDHEHLEPASQHVPIDYPKPDGVLTFDLATSLYRSGTNHDHDQPCHLQLESEGVPEVVNKKYYDGPEARYCPAGVYEYQVDEATGRPSLHINAQNCLHCKACDIKDPHQNIKWTVPEGGGGPNYTIT